MNHDYHQDSISTTSTNDNDSNSVCIYNDDPIVHYMLIGTS